MRLRLRARSRARARVSEVSNLVLQGYLARHDGPVET